MRLNEAQIAHYREHGYLILPDLVDAALRAELFGNISRVVAECPYGQDNGIVCWDKQIVDGVVKLSDADRELGVFKLHHPWKKDRYFRELLQRMPELEAVEQLLGGDLKAIAQQIVMKPPGHGQWQPYHQDGYYFNYEPSEGAAVWVALDEATVENGCLWIVPGSHQRAIVPHRKPADVEHINNGFLEAEGVRRDEGIPVTLPAGAAVVFHNRLLHMSGPNKSAFRRRGLVTHYASAAFKPRDPSKPHDYVLIRGREFAGCI
ncbi:MAG: phytanoyl-CoA dioxygenase family protein [Planctomycetota bacterium]|nr:phytanoyl-CoA dioxygenase family protein [Planctomycetota bacterium]